MTKDDRLWMRVHVDMVDHPKMVVLSDSAFRAFHSMLSYCRRLSNDGKMSAAVATRRWSAKSIRELTSNDPDQPSLYREGDLLVIHDYTDWQESRDEIEARKATNRANGSRGGQARAKRVASKALSDSATGSPSESLSEGSSQVQAEKEKEKLPSIEGRGVAARGSRIPEGWKPSSMLLEWGRTMVPSVDLAAQTERFTNYWLSTAGAKGRKVNWDLTWKNWMLEQHDRNKAAGWTASKTMKLREF